MTKRDNVIEVNGKRYDALTGRLLTTTTASRNSGVVLDGVSRASSHPSPAHHTPAQTAHQRVHHKTEKSKTLMRSVVHKPVTPPPHKPLQQKPAKHAPAHHTSPVQAISNERVKRATEIPKSSLISKFSAHVPKPLTAKIDLLPVQAAPPEEPAAHDTLFSSLHHATSPFQQAIERATSHTQPKAKKSRAHHKIARKLGVKPVTLSAGMAILAILFIGGFVAYQNVPNFAMRVAATRAGVRGALPNYKPSGFSLKGAIQSIPGQITISYHSVSDSREFKVIQRSSDWNNEALINNFVAVERRPYQIFQQQDKTIYIYDGDNATWVDRGVWYQIEGKSVLSSDQLLRMATSL